MEAIQVREVMDQDEAADYLRISPRTLELWRKKDFGPPIVRLGQDHAKVRIIYLKSDLDAWLQTQRVEMTPAEAN